MYKLGFMTANMKNAGNNTGAPNKPYDLTEEASRRGGDERAAYEARKAESDEVNEETNLGFVSTPEGDSAGENRVTTSISED